MSTRQKEKALARREKAKAAAPFAKLNLLRMPASKVRLVVDLIRMKPVEEALNILTFTPKSAARSLAKLLRSAVANADAKGYDVDQLIISNAQVGEAPQMKRFRPRAMGRANRILKRTCHITLELNTKAKLKELKLAAKAPKTDVPKVARTPKPQAKTAATAATAPKAATAKASSKKPSDKAKTKA